MAQLTELVIRYDLDDCDVCWLEDVNVFRREIGGRSFIRVYIYIRSIFLMSYDVSFCVCHVIRIVNRM